MRQLELGKKPMGFFRYKKTGNAMLDIYGALDLSGVQSISGYKRTCCLFLV